MGLHARGDLGNGGLRFRKSLEGVKGEGKHLTIWGRYIITALALTDKVEIAFDTHLSIKVWVWPNGFQQKVVGKWDPGVIEN